MSHRDPQDSSTAETIFIGLALAFCGLMFVLGWLWW